MIRDPSDGSIRDNPELAVELSAEIQFAKNAKKSGPVIDTSTSGLPMTKAKAVYLARLEESRKWLKDFVQKNSTAS
jgi:hypothetical protein